MTLDEYGEWAATIPKPEHPSREQRLAYLGLGLAGEAGEVADTLRRGMRDGRLNEDRLAYELADLLFHCRPHPGRGCRPYRAGGGGQDPRAVASDPSLRRHRRRHLARPGGEVF